jgi:hypothetical protein
MLLLIAAMVVVVDRQAPFPTLLVVTVVAA